MVEYKVLVKKSTTLFMKDSLRMTFIMVMEDTFTPMVIITYVIGSMVNGPDGANWSTNQAKFTKVCGNTVNS
jgi:hypothetical protein